METEVAWGPLPSSGQSCLPIQPSVGEEAVQEMDGDSGRGEVRLRRSPPQKQGWAGGTGRCSWEETGQGRGSLVLGTWVLTGSERSLSWELLQHSLPVRPWPRGSFRPSWTWLKPEATPQLCPPPTPPRPTPMGHGELSPLT